MMHSPSLLLPFSFSIFNKISDKANNDTFTHWHNNQNIDKLHLYPTTPTTSRIASNHAS